MILGLVARYSKLTARISEMVAKEETVVARNLNRDPFENEAKAT